jgi:glycerophosphoryl diester phosphodiesterase
MSRPWARPRVVAHRGASAAAPENTLAAFRRAWALGCEAVELDVHLSADGHVVVHHDQDLLRTAGVARLVRECTLAELRALEVGSWKRADFLGEPIPTLAEVFAAAPSGSTIFVEVKAPPSATPAIGEALAALRDAHPAVTLGLQSFDVGALVQLVARLPGAAAFWTVGAPKQDDVVFPYPPVILERARALGLAGVALDARGTTDGLLDEAAASGVLVDLWTVNEAAALAAWLSRAEVRWVETDHPDLAAPVTLLVE